MPRVNYVRRARKSKNARRCHRCGHVVQPGESYRHWSFMVGGRGGPMIVACERPECAPKPSDLTRSPHLQALYVAQESAEEELGGWEAGPVPLGEEPDASGLEEILSSYAEALSEVGQGLTESAEALEAGFGHPTSQSDELTERAESYNAAASEVEGWVPPDFSAPDAEGEDPQDAWDEAIAAWAEEATSSARDAIFVEAY